MTMRPAGVAMVMAAAMVVVACGGAAESDLGSNAQAVASSMPKGAHFNLNIIGKDKAKAADLSCGDGHVIFVPLGGTSKILLSEGDFSVLDCNGTDGSASFQLPNPDPTNSGTTTFSVWARALGKPGGSSTTTTCATDPTTLEQYCSVSSVSLVRVKGHSTFTNVSRDLLYMSVDLDGDGVTERVPLFDSRLQDYFWNYQNDGLRLAQLRFYAVPTTVQ